MRPEQVLQTKYTDIRHMLYVVRKDTFKALYLLCKDKKVIDDSIASCDRAAFDKWMRDNRDVEDLSVSELRLKARDLHLQNLSRLDKCDLITKVKNANA